MKEWEAYQAFLVGGFLVCLSQEGGLASWVGPLVQQAWLVCDLVWACPLKRRAKCWKRVVQRQGGQILVKRWIWGSTKDYYYVPSTRVLHCNHWYEGDDGYIVLVTKSCQNILKKWRNSQTISDHLHPCLCSMFHRVLDYCLAVVVRVVSCSNQVNALI